MSSLQRYRKAGGFFQLLSLIETFGPQKREKFLEMIEAESPGWACALRDKMLSIERIFAWPEQVVIEIFKRLPPKGQAFALTGLKDEQKAKINPFISVSEQRRMSDVLTETQPRPEDIAATMVKMVEITRRMLQDRDLNAEKFDERLVIPENFELKIESMSAGEPVSRPEPGAPPPSALSTPPVVSNGSSASLVPPEVMQLQRSLATVLKENKTLKEEARALRDKLDQIRRIA